MFGINSAHFRIMHLWKPISCSMTFCMTFWQDRTVLSDRVSDNIRASKYFITRLEATKRNNSRPSPKDIKLEFSFVISTIKLVTWRLWVSFKLSKLGPEARRVPPTPRSRQGPRASWGGQATRLKARRRWQRQDSSGKVSSNYFYYPNGLRASKSEKVLIYRSSNFKALKSWKGWLRKHHPVNLICPFRKYFRSWVCAIYVINADCFAIHRALTFKNILLASLRCHIF